MVILSWNLLPLFNSLEFARLWCNTCWTVSFKYKAQGKWKCPTTVLQSWQSWQYFPAIFLPPNTLYVSVFNTLFEGHQVWHAKKKAPVCGSVTHIWQQQATSQTKTTFAIKALLNSSESRSNTLASTLVSLVGGRVFLSPSRWVWTTDLGS